MAKRWPPKDPQEYLDYAVDWTARLAAGDSIASSSWHVPDGLTSDAESFSATVTLIWIGGGAENETHDIVNRIVTSGGRRRRGGDAEGLGRAAGGDPCAVRNLNAFGDLDLPTQ